MEIHGEMCRALVGERGGAALLVVVVNKEPFSLPRRLNEIG